MPSPPDEPQHGVTQGAGRGRREESSTESCFIKLGAWDCNPLQPEEQWALTVGLGDPKAVPQGSLCLGQLLGSSPSPVQKDTPPSSPN